jgi:hypothetical protein
MMKNKKLLELPGSLTIPAWSPPWYLEPRWSQRTHLLGKGDSRPWGTQESLWEPVFCCCFEL